MPVNQNRLFLPVGNPDFPDMRTYNGLYVDKTAQLLKLVEDRAYKFLFLSRPRRFGKSLMISTLEAMFQGKAELFKGLAAEDWVIEQAKKPSPVLRFDMSQPDSSSLDNLLKGLLRQVRENARKLGLVVTEDSDPAGAFADLLFDAHEKFGELVVLIDEYDAPILHNIHRPEQAEATREKLQAFYTNLKSKAGYLKFLMITGISKFSKMSIFSAMNNLSDISMSPEFGTILGFTQEELEKSFTPWLTDFVQTNGGTPKDLLFELKYEYDGFCFDGEHHVYNPWSVLKCLQTKSFDAFWYGSGTPSALAYFIKKYGIYDPSVYEGISVDRNFVDAREIEHATPESFLFQSGYLTIKDWPFVRSPRGIRRPSSNIVLDYPNREVREAIQKTYLEEIYGIKNFRSIANDLWLALSEGKLDSAIEQYNSIIASLPYQAFGETKLSEALFQMLFQAIMRTAGPAVLGEGQVECGRFDTTIMIPQTNRVYVFEFKLAENAGAVQEKLDRAIDQIGKKCYAAPWYKSGQEITAIGIAIDVETKQASFKAERIEG